MQRAADSSFNRVLAELTQHGILVKSDPKLPSVTTLVAGEPVRGSWWGHPKGHQIFQLLEVLADHEDATLAKLISGKDTFVHKKLFVHLMSVGSAREGWQLDGLSAGACRLLEQVDKEGAVRTESLRLPGMTGPKEVGAASLELEKCLLVRAENVHTSSGKHAKSLEAWERWADRIGVEGRIAAKDAKGEFERILDLLNRRFQGRGLLPWQAID